MKACPTGTAEASWPGEDAVGDSEWDQFFERGRKTFLQHKGGDDLRAMGKALESEVNESKGLREMFGDHVDQELVESVAKATKDIEALVFAVKTMRWWGKRGE